MSDRLLGSSDGVELICAVCRVQTCREEPGRISYPVFCPMSQETEALAKARVAYEDQEIQRLLRPQRALRRRATARSPGSRK